MQSDIVVSTSTQLVKQSLISSDVNKTFLFNSCQTVIGIFSVSFELNKTNIHVVSTIETRRKIKPSTEISEPLSSVNIVNMYIA